MNIAICGLVYSDNLGEKFISDSLSYLIKRELEKNKIYNVKFVEVDIFAREKYLTQQISNRHKVEHLYQSKDLSKVADAVYCAKKLSSKLLQKIGLKNAGYRLMHHLWQSSYNCRPRHEAYFRDKFKGIDVIVIDGAGLLEYVYNEYQEMLNLIRELAEEMGLPVIYNAVGCVGEYNLNDFRCTIMKKAIDADCVKYVSARDSVETVQQYVGDKFKVKQVADAAVWAREAYGISVPENRKKIGIGLIRGNSLLGYHVAFGEEDWITLYCNIICELEKRGYSYELFCNGFLDDYEMGKKILARLGKDLSLLVDRPTSSSVLINTIAQYRALITCRMHSSIAAYSMQIPAVVMSWNDKIDKFMQLIGYPERAVGVRDFKADYIVDLMERSIAEGFEPERYNRIRASAVESVADYVGLLIDTAKQ